ncbi:MAG: THUMP domain-containing protein, partial [Gammaproteobacteria bacterium]
EGDLRFAYQICLWSRLANRILYTLAKQTVESSQALYDAIYAIDWQQQMAPDATLWIDFAGTCPGISNSQFGAQKVKDAIVDYFRDKTGMRPT